MGDTIRQLGLFEVGNGWQHGVIEIGIALLAAFMFVPLRSFVRSGSSEMSGSKRVPVEPTTQPSKPPDQGEPGPTSGSPSRDAVGLVDDMPGAIRRSSSGVRQAIAAILRRW